MDTCGPRGPPGGQALSTTRQPAVTSSPLNLARAPERAGLGPGWGARIAAGREPWGGGAVSGGG